MSITVSQGFEILRNNLRITDLQEETVSKRQKNLRANVEAEMEVVDTFLTGSYERQTMITPLSKSDVDIFFVMSPSYFHENGQGALLDKVKRVLEKTYPTTSKISRNGQAVTIAFSDFSVDVVPGFSLDTGGYVIADSIRNEWITTDPKKHVDLWKKSNVDQRNLLSPVAKMMKAWNRVHSRTLRSFHLEMMVLFITRNIKIGRFQETMGYLFERAQLLIGHPIPDPAGFGDNVGANVNTAEKIDRILSRLQTAHTRSIAAIEFESEGKVAEAFDQWRNVFGDYFPSYS